jgi:hypothetical protein
MVADALVHKMNSGYSDVRLASRLQDLKMVSRLMVRLAIVTPAIDRLVFFLR